MHGMREAQLGAVAPRRQAPLRKEQVCGRKTLGALVCGKGELRNEGTGTEGTSGGTRQERNRHRTGRVPRAGRISRSRQGQSEQPVPDGSGSDNSY